VYSPVFQVRTFESVPHEGKLRILTGLLEALIAANLVYLDYHPETPLLSAIACLANPDVVYRQRQCMHYEFEPEGSDNWQDIPETLSLGFGDCEDLASWRVAELRHKGETNARPYVIHTKLPSGQTLYHIQVERADGRIEDPSVQLGMPPPPATMTA